MTAVAVHHVVTGPSDAPVVVLSNSLGSTHTMWDAQADALSEHFRVVRYDTRGHGGSPVPAGPYDIDDLADDVVALLDTLGVEQAHFVGLSLGGMTGMRLAARNPERVDRLVVLCTGAHLTPSSAWTDRAGNVRANGSESVAEAVVARWFTPGFLDANPDVKASCETLPPRRRTSLPSLTLSRTAGSSSYRKLPILPTRSSPRPSPRRSSPT